MELVERAELLAELRALLAQARAGSGRVVLLGGEAGVGKTSLIREFVARKPGLRILWGSCEPLLTPEPLGPFHDMPPIAAAIVRKESRIQLLGAILDQLRTPPGTVLVVEDAHWADEASLDALRYVGRRAHTTPGMLVLTFRDDEALPGSPLRSVVCDLATAPGCRRLHVPPLRAAAVVRGGYLRGSLPRTPTARQVDVLAAFVATGGSVADAAAQVDIRPSTAKRHRRPAGTLWPHDRAADLRRTGWGVAGRPESRARLTGLRDFLVLHAAGRGSSRQRPKPARGCWRQGVPRSRPASASASHAPPGRDLG